MNIEDEVMNFKNLEISKYLNKMHSVYDETLIVNSRDELLDMLNGLDSELYKFFELKSTALMDLLIVNEECHNILTEFKGKSKVHIQTETPFVNEPLKKAFKVFKDEMSVFITDRYLIKTGFFNDKKVYLLLTNDMVFIGKLEEDGYKYFGSSNVKNLKLEFNEKLIIKSDSFEIELEKNDLSEEIHNAILDLNFEFVNISRREKEEIDYIDFCLDTGRLSEIIGYMKENRSKSDIIKKQIKNKKNINIETGEDLLKYIEILDYGNESKEDTIKFVSNYFLIKFEDVLKKINRIQLLKDLIRDCFAYLNDFSKKMIEFCSFNPKCYILGIELLVLKVLESLRPRINSAGYINKCDSKELFKNRMIICKLNYEYVLQDFKFKDMGIEYLDNSKQIIKDCLRRYFSD